MPGITRATIIELCNELNIPVEERFFNVEELKKADAAFFCGTGAEVIGFESLDDYEFPLNWNDSVSRKLQVAYMKLVKEDFSEAQRTQSRETQSALSA